MPFFFSLLNPRGISVIRATTDSHHTSSSIAAHRSPSPRSTTSATTFELPRSLARSQRPGKIRIVLPEKKKRTTRRPAGRVVDVEDCDCGYSCDCGSDDECTLVGGRSEGYYVSSLGRGRYESRRAMSGEDRWERERECGYDLEERVPKYASSSPSRYYEGVNIEERSPWQYARSNPPRTNGSGSLYSTTVRTEGGREVPVVANVETRRPTGILRREGRNGRRDERRVRFEDGV